MRPKVIIILVLIVVAVIILFQNTHHVRFGVLFWSIETPLIVLSAIVLAIGFVLGLSVANLPKSRQ